MIFFLYFFFDFRAAIVDCLKGSPWNPVSFDDDLMLEIWSTYFTWLFAQLWVQELFWPSAVFMSVKNGQPMYGYVELYIVPTREFRFLRDKLISELLPPLGIREALYYINGMSQGIPSKFLRWTGGLRELCHGTRLIHEVHTISSPTFFVWALLLIVHTWNSSPLRSNLLRLQCTCCAVPTSSARPHGSPLVWACQWPSSQPLSSPQFSQNDSLWAKGINKSHREQGLDYRDDVELFWCPSWSKTLLQGWSYGQLSHKMYGNNILNFQESMTILNAHTKKFWNLCLS